MDYTFYDKLNHYPHREVYAKIESLSWTNEQPVESIVGRITSGNINISGSAQVARTCSLSMVALDNDIQVTDSLWGFKTKFSVQIGLKNPFEITPEHPEIIWFPQGVYIIKSFTKGYSTNSPINISISGQDKMCMLNGQIGGNLPYEVNFGEEDIQKKIDKPDGSTEIQIKTKKVPLKTIITQMIREYGREKEDNIIIDDLPDQGYDLWEYRGKNPLYIIVEPDTEQAQQLSMVPVPVANGNYYSYNALWRQNQEIQYGTYPYADKDHYVAKLVTGQTAGYHPTDFVYAGDLVGGVNATVSSILDKIVQMLGEYEYFYDVNGKFIFRKRQGRLSDGAFIVENGDLVANFAIVMPKIAYTFQDNTLVVSKNKTPKIDVIKNDYSIWGTTKNDLPCHIRYAIDRKPATTNYQDLGIIDWREYLYQLTLLYQRNSLSHWQNENELSEEQKQDYIHYQPYYTDLQGFWRYLYNPSGITDELGNEFYTQDDAPYPSLVYWNKKVYLDPSSLLFWFDFLDPTLPKYANLEPFAVYNIGNRTFAENNNAVTSIYYPGTPDLVFLLPDDTLTDQNMGTSLRVTEDTAELFSISTQGLSAFARLNNVLYQHACFDEGLSLTCIPMYQLQPNTRIRYEGHDYNLDQISYSLTYNGTMSLTLSKIVEGFGIEE